MTVAEDPAIRLQVPLRSFRSPRVSEWVAAVIRDESEQAFEIATVLGESPILLTRSLESARAWLCSKVRGLRRYGFVASSGAQRLRAEGLGVSLNATDSIKIAQWYLNDPGDVYSFALEVTANEYTSQGLELDFVGLCWGGDLLRSENHWVHRRFRGNRWDLVTNHKGRRFIENSYRVLMTRAREGLVIWAPKGSCDDPTRDHEAFDITARFLARSGAHELRSEDA